MNRSDQPATTGEQDGWASGAWIVPPPRRRPLRRTVAVSALTLVAVAAAGAPLGLLWRVVSPTIPVVRTTQGQVVVNDPAPEQFIAADAWFAILGLVFGVLAAVSAWLLLRRHRGPALLGSVAAGSLAAAVVAWQAGRLLGLADYQQWRAATTAAGDTFARPPDLHSHGALLVPAFAAVIACTLLAGWSNDPDLEPPGEHPGEPDGGDSWSTAAPDSQPDVSSGWSGEPDRPTAPAPPGPGSTGRSPD